MQEVPDYSGPLWTNPFLLINKNKAEPVLRQFMKSGGSIQYDLLAYLESIEPYKINCGYKIPGEFLIGAGVK